jgi:hypothetical protein
VDQFDCGGQKEARLSDSRLLRHHFIDPDARYVRIALRHLFCSFKAVGAQDRESGDGFRSQWQNPLFQLSRFLDHH